MSRARRYRLYAVKPQGKKRSGERGVASLGLVTMKTTNRRNWGSYEVGIAQPLLGRFNSRSVSWNPGYSHGRTGPPQNGVVHAVLDAGIDSRRRMRRASSLHFAYLGKKRCRLSISLCPPWPSGSCTALVSANSGMKWRMRCFTHTCGFLKDNKHVSTQQSRSSSATLWR